MSVLNNLNNIKDIYCNGKRIKIVYANNKIVYQTNKINPSYNYLVFNISESMGGYTIELSSNRRGDNTEWDGLTDWGDGTIDSLLTHTYATDGIYTVKTKLMPEDKTTKKMLIGCNNVNKNITDASLLFSSCINLKYIDMSRIKSNIITNMRSMFYECVNLRELNMDGLDTSNVTDMFNMFSYCSIIPTYISNFDVSNVINMDSMFSGCDIVDVTLFKNWNLSNVIYMRYMFMGANIYGDLDLSMWNMSNVEYIDGMFMSANIHGGLDVSTWNVSNIKSFGYVFSDCRVDTQINVSYWNNILSYATTTGMLKAKKRACKQHESYGESFTVFDCDNIEHFVIHNGVSDENWQRMISG